MKNIKKFFEISIKEIAFASILVSLIILAKMPFMSINLGVMRIGVSYIFLILVGLILRPFIGLLTVLIGDNLGMVISGNIAMWHYAYAAIPIMIFLLTYFLKRLYYIKSLKKVVMIGSTISFVIFATLIFIFIFENNFVKKGNPSSSIDFTDRVTNILIYTMTSLVALWNIAIIIIYIKKRSLHWKNIYITNIIVSIIVIIVIWLYGPFANVLWLSDMGKFSGTNYYWKLYKIYQIPRLLKTPLALFVYTMIISPVWILLSNKFTFYNW